MKKTDIKSLAGSRSKSEVLFDFCCSTPRIKTNKNPFIALENNRKAKLVPVSPSGCRLPTIQSKAVVLNVKSNAGKTEKQSFDLIFRLNRVKHAPTASVVPRTPYFNIRRKDQATVKEVKTDRSKYPDKNFKDISFSE